jgi:hypothetical protein
MPTYQSVVYSSDNGGLILHLSLMISGLFLWPSFAYDGNVTTLAATQDLHAFLTY